MSVQYLDRVLSCQRIFKSQLQLVAASCLFLASKLCEVEPLSVKKLVIYTDCSITSDQLLSMEMQILDKLSWELCAITSLDFLQLIVRRYCPTGRAATNEVERTAAAFLSLAATEYQFYCVRPSMMAGAAFLAALARQNRCLAAGNLEASLSSLLVVDQVTSASDA